jgi:Protein of unknown function (DUF3237)
MNDAVQEAVQTGAETAYADQYFRIAPRLETGDPRYAWVNQTLSWVRVTSTRGLAWNIASTA